MHRLGAILLSDPHRRCLTKSKVAACNGRDVWTVVDQEDVEAEPESTLLQREEIANDSRSETDWDPGPDAVECATGQKSSIIDTSASSDRASDSKRTEYLNSDSEGWFTRVFVQKPSKRSKPHQEHCSTPVYTVRPCTSRLVVSATEPFNVPMSSLQGRTSQMVQPASEPHPIEEKKRFSIRMRCVAQGADNDMT